MQENQTKLKALYVNKVGNSRRILWESNEVNYQIDRDAVMQAQREAGYDPCGYGCDNIAIRKITETEWKATWSCSGSCD